MAALVRNMIRVLGTWVAAGDTTPPPPTGQLAITTESGLTITTESGLTITTES